MTTLTAAAGRRTEPPRERPLRTPLARQAGDLPASVARLLTADAGQPLIVSAFQSSV